MCNDKFRKADGWGNFIVIQHDHVFIEQCQDCTDFPHRRDCQDYCREPGSDDQCSSARRRSAQPPLLRASEVIGSRR